MLKVLYKYLNVLFLPLQKLKIMNIEWTEKLSVNNQTIDSEHKSLFDALGMYYKGVQNGASKESLQALLSNLSDYVVTHFNNEERYLLEIGYSDLPKHKEEHRAFTDKVKEFINSYNSGKAPASYEVTHFIMDWIVNHIKREDMRYARYAQGR
ncbi:MAG TPA: hemerythrin [Marinilabiliaceae bacterium]|jgi:hemerythrin|nr:hemerythrin [Marinilabiliaceae bacterium]HBX88043.1 hemerythrin [Marinilabiliaceae bacterium]